MYILPKGGDRHFFIDNYELKPLNFCYCDNLNPLKPYRLYWNIFQYQSLDFLNLPLSFVQYIAKY